VAVIVSCPRVHSTKPNPNPNPNPNHNPNPKPKPNPRNLGQMDPRTTGRTPFVEYKKSLN